MDRATTVLMRCDADRDIGFGHMTRCLAIAEELASGHGIRPAFAMRRGVLGIEHVRRAGHEVITPLAGEVLDQARWIERLVVENNARALVVDVRDDLSSGALQSVRALGARVVVIDDDSERRLAADFAVYPPVPQVHRLDWTGFTGELRVGWEWIILRRQFAQKPSRKAHDDLKLLVTMGGSDPAGLTLKAVAALDKLDEPFQTAVVLGPGFGHEAALDTLLANSSRRYEIHRNVEDMVALMAEVDLAVASFGMTAYELAAMGVPAIHLCLSEDHERSASAFVEAGIALSLGSQSAVGAQRLAAAVRAMRSEPARLRQMGESAKRLVDGRGARRVARIVANGSIE